MEYDPEQALTAPHWASAASVSVCGALVLLLSLSGVALPSGPDRAAGEGEFRSFVGLKLSEALFELQAQGLAIVFTSELVRPEMVVELQPTATEPRRVLDQILAPHGLRAEDGAGGTVVVVPAGRERTSSITGRVRAAATQEPVAEATIRVVEPGIEVRSGADGQFEIADVEPGLYTLEARRAGFLAKEVGEVAVPADRAAQVLLTLEPTPFIHDEIAVRASRLSLLREEPVAPLSLSRGEIEALPHLGGDVFRALSLLPGVTANDVTAQFSIHGGRRDEVQVVLDGQELYDAYHLKEFDNALSIVASEELSSVSLTTGGFAASHGDRMSGVLDLTTSIPSGPGHTRLSLSLLKALAARSGTFWNERGGWLASGRWGTIELASRIFGSEDPTFWDGFAKMEYRLGERNQLRAHLLRAGDDLDFDEAVDGEVKSFDTEYDNLYLWLVHEALLGERLLVESSVSRSGIERDRRGAETEEEQSFEVFDQRDSEVTGLAQAWSFQATPRHSARWGIELRSYDAEYDYLNDVDLGLVLGTPLSAPRTGVPRLVDEFDGEHLSGWLSDRFSPVEPLTVELGLRYDRHALTDDNFASPRVNVAWRIGEASVVRGAWGHFYQSQRPYELQIEDGEIGFFKAERSEHWVVGYERLLGQQQRTPLRALRIEAYRREISDPRPSYQNLFEPVNAFPEIEPDRVRIAPDHSSAEGIELVLRGAAGPRVDWWMSYAYSSAEDRIAGEEVRRQLDQPHTLNLDVNCRLGQNWNLNLAWRFRSGWPTTPVALEEVESSEGEPELVPVLGPLNSDRLPSYHRMDMRASRHWQLRSGRLVFFVDVQNLYDRDNLAGFDLEVDEDSRQLITEAEHWTGVFPSAGVAWEF